jgi:hypothetical protein
MSRIAPPARAAVGASDCITVCVVLIQVDGLEPKDVTPQQTPIMWGLAHSDSIGSSGNGSNVPGLSGRAGYMWQAARSVVGAGTAPNTASLLSSAYPERSGVPADLYKDSDGSWRGLYGSADAGGDNGPDHPSLIDPSSTSLLESVSQDGKDLAFSGDPALKQLIDNGPANEGWTPDYQHIDPHLCLLPPELTMPDTPSDPNSWASKGRCVSNDHEVIQQAITDMTGEKGAGTQLAFIHLAELGRVKMLHGDTDSAQASGQTSAAVGEALADTDSAIGAFVAQEVAKGPAEKWAKTVMFVVGSHGYETTPISHRVPYAPKPGTDTTTPNTDNATKDFSDFVAEAGGKLAPQGTAATVYFNRSAQEDDDSYASRLAELRQKILSVNSVCLGQAGAALQGVAQGTECIDKVLYVRKPAGANIPADQLASSYHIDAVGKDGVTPTGASGELLVIAKPLWAFGRPTWVPTQPTDLVGIPSANGLQGVGVSQNPFLGSSGAPRDRAIAAFVNGPSSVVRGWAYDRNGGRAPVTKSRDDSRGDPLKGISPDATAQKDPAYPSSPSVAGQAQLDVSGVYAANDNPSANPAAPDNDANALGHEAQLETVDVAPTIAALLRVSFPGGGASPDQIQGAIAQEAFRGKLSLVSDNEDIGEAEPEPEPPPPPPPPPPLQIEPEQPQPDRCQEFSGLVREVKATVVDDKDGHTVAEAKVGAPLNTIRLEGGFGKPKSQATLTFYRDIGARAHAAKAKKRGKSNVPSNLRALVQFKPFTVPHGCVTIKLKVPPQFSPTHVGLTIQEAKDRDVPPKQRLGGNGQSGASTTFVGVGPTKGLIVPIKDAVALHHRKTRALAKKLHKRSAKSPHKGKRT